MTVRAAALSAGLLLLTLGCGTAGPGGSGLNANLINREQLDEYGPATAYEVVQALRPTWLQKRGNTSFMNEGEIRVYLDGTSHGGIDSLRAFHTDDVESIRYLDERQASYRYGPGHEHGVILITSRR